MNDQQIQSRTDNEINYSIIRDAEFEYIQTNPDNPNVLILLHGLFGAMSNFKCILSEFGNKMNIVIPILPFFKLPIKEVNVVGLMEHVRAFINYLNFGKIHLLGNSVGGHIGLLYTLENATRVKSLILTGSSGLYESGLGSSFPRRGDYEYIRDVSVKVFYDISLATKDMVDEVFDIVNDPPRAIRVLHIARSAIRYNLSNEIHRIKCPVLLVWGKNDTITPPFVAEKFAELVEDTHLYWIDKCGHAPMMEHPFEFNRILKKFMLEIGEQSLEEKEV